MAEKKIFTSITLGFLYLFLGVGLLILSQGEFAGIKPDLRKIQQSLGSSLGVAFIGSGVITLTIERQNEIERKKKLSETTEALEQAANTVVEEIKYESKKQLISTLFPSGQADLFTDQIIYHITEEKFITQNRNLTIKLFENSQDKTTLKGNITVSYDITNVSNKLLDYPVKVAFERYRLIDNQNDGLREVLINYKNKKENKDNNKEKTYVEQMKDQIDNEKKDDKSILVAQIFIKVKANTSIPVKIIYELTFNKNDREIWVVSKLAAGMRILVDYPKDKIKLFGNILHPDVLRMEDIYPRKIIYPGDNDTIPTWEIRSGLLPFQGIELEWRELPSPLKEHPIDQDS